MAEENKTGFMALIGKMTTIAAFIIAIFTIVRFIAEPQSDLTAQVQWGDFSFPPDVILRHERLRGEMNSRTLEKHFKESIKDLDDDDKKNAYLFADSASGLLADIIDSPFLYVSHTSPSGWVQISIRNSGTKTITGARVSVPWKISHEVQRDDKRVFLSSSEPIDLGSIRPQESIAITCWLSSPLSSHSSSDVAIVHDLGIADVEYFVPTSSKSVGAFISRWGILIFPLVVSGVFILVVFLLAAFETAKANRANTNNDKSQPQNGNEEVEQDVGEQPPSRRKSKR